MLISMKESLATVMVVDRDRAALSQTADLLEEAGHRVIRRDVGIGTGGAILRTRPDVVLLELAMPLLDGAEIIEVVRASETVAGTRMVLMGALPAAELAALAERCGANASLAKPFGAEALRAAVRRFARPRRDGPTKRSGTRRVRGYVLVAAGEETRRDLRGTLGARADTSFTDSGTEALRLILGPAAPRVALLGTSLLDMSFDVVWRHAVERDPSWRERIVIAVEGALERALDPEMRHLDSDHEITALLDLLLDQVEQPRRVM